MLISCAICGTSYEVAPDALGPTGRSVRCVRCQYVWFAPNTEAMGDVAEAHRTDMMAFSAMSGAGAAGAALAPGAVTSDEPAPPIQVQAEPASRLDFPPPLAPEADDALATDAVPPEPVAISDAPPLAPSEISSAADPAGEDIESAAARRAQRVATRRRRWQQSILSTAILVLLAINLSFLGWRADIVRWLPQTASLYAAIGLPVNLRGLVFVKVTTETQNHEGVAVLVVAGEIVNDSKRALEVPRLRFAIRNQDGQEISSWTALPEKNALMAGEALPFVSRLAAPPREGQQVQVRFFNRRDLVAGIQ
jgi:predicted Zn finger-like uncharacterized protein